MKKYMIPIGMAAGTLVGLLIGWILHFAAGILACAGAAFGIMAGAIAQLVWNQLLPDSYFEKKKKRTQMDTSLFSEEEVALREEMTVGHAFHEKNVEEEDEDSQKPEQDPAVLAEQERRAAQRREWEALQAKRRQENLRNSSAQSLTRNTAPRVSQPTSNAATRPTQPGQRVQQSRQTASQARPPKSEPAKSQPVKPQSESRRSMFEEPKRPAAETGKRRVIIEEDDD